MYRLGLLVMVAAVALAGCSAIAELKDDSPWPGAWATYDKHLRLARAGDAESQNLVAFMLFFGQGTAVNRPEAVRWMQAAANQGNAKAQRNLAVLHYLGWGVPEDREAAERYFDRASRRPASLRPGAPPARAPASITEFIATASAEREATPTERLYGTFCAGCHGLNGIAGYVNSPSFALGERLDKPDAVLLDSVMRGIRDMPGWEDKLPRAELARLVRFIRTLGADYEDGIARLFPSAPPPVYFLFGPMRENPTAFVWYAPDGTPVRPRRAITPAPAPIDDAFATPARYRR